MGRGRAKAKQTKVARQLKYYAPQTDLDALREELSTGQPDSEADYGELADTYADLDEEDEPDEPSR